jgi:nucleoside-diphosphate-sugar epimerase
MCYIDNVVSANVLAAKSKNIFKGECYNIACNSRVTNKEILDYFVSEFGSKVKHAPWRAGDVMHTQADVTKARNDFGYEPIVKFWEGLENTVRWWGLRDG